VGVGKDSRPHVFEKQEKLIHIDREVSEERKRGPVRARNSDTGELGESHSPGAPPTQQEEKECRVM
jgi:hypothetical protein